jgi:DNA mismatch repair protein MutS2
VLLKALALISLLVQSGVPAPVSGESRVAVFDDVFADVGDEQSIQASLSTFSAHLKNQAEILGLATHASLVLMDEVGSGTDPLEGAALGGAILEELTRRGTTTIATTHLGALKELATEVRGVVNASLQFDAVQLAPTYRLIKGVPGRSYGISIARRLALPTAVIERAEERVPRASATSSASSRSSSAARRSCRTRSAPRAPCWRTRARRRSGSWSASSACATASARWSARRARRPASTSSTPRRSWSARSSRCASRRRRGGRAGPRGAAPRRAARRPAGRAARPARARGAQRVTRRTRRAAPPRRPAELRAGDVVEVGTLGGKLGRVLERRNGQAVVAVGGSSSPCR